MPETLYVEGLKVSGTPWDVTLLFSNGNDSQTVKATVFDVEFGFSEIRKQDVNVDTTLPFDADKSAPLQWNVTKKKDLSDYLTAVSQLASGGLQWKRNEVTITSSILDFRQASSVRKPLTDNIITFNVEVTHQQYSHLSGKFILVIYPDTTADEYRNWANMNQSLTWTDNLPQVYSALDTNNANEDPEPPTLECTNWKPPSDLSSHYHPGATHEMRTEMIGPENGHGHQATYDSGGDLITSGLGAGTADYVSPEISMEIISFIFGLEYSHLNQDVKPFIWAAQLDDNPVKEIFDFEDLTHLLMHRGGIWVNTLDSVRKELRIPLIPTCVLSCKPQSNPFN